MQSQSTIEATSVETQNRNHARPFPVRLVASIVAGLCALSAFVGFASMAGAQEALPAAACEAFTKWERGELNPQYVDIALLPLKDVTLPTNLDTVVKGLAGRKFQGQAEEQAIQKLVDYYKAGCANGSGGNTTGAVAATANTAGNAAAAATPVATTLPTTITPTPAATGAPTKATPAPTAAPAKQLPNTGFNRASSGLAMLGGWLLLAGIAVSLFNRQRN